MTAPLTPARGESPKPLSLRLLLWTMLVGALFGLLSLGDPLEIALRTGRSMLRSHSVSGDIVVVTIDDRSLDVVNRWPWPRSAEARLAEQLFARGARRVFFDIDFSTPSQPEEDRRLAQTFHRFGHRIVIAGRFFVDYSSSKYRRIEAMPLPMFTQGGAAVGSINHPVSYIGAILKEPFSTVLAGRQTPTFSALLGRLPPRGSGFYLIDFSYDPGSIPTISAADILSGATTATEIKGKDVIVGVASDQIPDMFQVPGRSRIPGVYFHVLGAETLRAGVPVDAGWWLPFLIAAAISIACGFVRRAMPVILILSATTAGLLILPFCTEPSHIYLTIVPSLAMLLVQIGVLAYRETRRVMKERATTNAISGLLNLNALRQDGGNVGQMLVVARVHNFAAVIATMHADAERILVEQIAARLTLGGAPDQLYQGDDGVFAWFVSGDLGDIGEHLNALHTVFRSPVTVLGSALDLSVTFGVDDTRDRSLANRLGSALVAAGEAAEEGGRWKRFDTDSLKDVAWQLSLLNQLDSAIDAGDLWVAYQPKLDLATNRILGAEALCRWTHPEKGNIPPMEFIVAAEQHNRIEKLTLHVLDRAILAAAEVNGRGIPFEVAVNISARLLESSGLVPAIRRLLDRHGLDPRRLTLEITETAAMTGGNAHDILCALRDMGVTISIDDYGTGLSTLEYLKKIPAREIKIDRSFVQAMGNSASDLLMVNSTIQLAHSLGHKVVAEGVENEETLDRLMRLSCDTAQGYFIGRPMTFEALSARLAGEGRQVA
jgi:EAL domain-containing protein (putative c-di-GMP-specific phosphodiesterase class I)/CHASE2 domain-containing sensor protein